MLLVGLTGNVASGKSEVSRRLADRGATIIDADVLAREAVERGTPAYDAIVARWGARMLRPDGTIDRAALRHTVFRDAAEREALNAIVHPWVERRRNALVEEARRRGDQIVVCDIPLLFERQLQAEFDRVILVDAPAGVRLERLMTSRRLDRSEAEQMIAAQMLPEAKRALSDYIIDNVDSLAALDARVNDVWKELVAHNS
jgi:dephospho-CoA kinase